MDVVKKKCGVECEAYNNKEARRCADDQQTTGRPDGRAPEERRNQKKATVPGIISW